MIPKIFSRLFGVKKSGPPPNTQAKKRLQLALLYDKLDISDEMIQSLQKDIVNVLSRYFEIDHDALRLDITREDDGMSALILNTPILSAKRILAPAATVTKEGTKTSDVEKKDQAFVSEEAAVPEPEKNTASSASSSKGKSKTKKKK